MRISSSGTLTSSELPYPGRRVTQEPSENGLVVRSRVWGPAGHPARSAREQPHDSLRDDLAHLRMGEPHQIAAAPEMRLADQIGHGVDGARGEPGSPQRGHRI